MTLNWLFLDLNSYFASVEQVENPHLRNRPVAVVPMIADTTCCIAASYEAKAYGVKTGTTVFDAKRMCPGIIFVCGEHRKYTAYHHRIIDVVERCLPVSKVLSIDEMACNLIGRERLEHNARAKAIEIKEAIYQEISPYMTCSIGIAPNRYLAKVASDMQKPNGLTVIHADQIPGVFYNLTPRDFPGIGHNMERRFFENQVLTVEQLYKLSIEQMRHIWGGIIGEEFWRLIRGEDLREKATNRSTIGHSHVIPPKFRNRKDAFAICVRLLSKACMRLREEQYYARELQLGIKFMGRRFMGGGDPTTKWYAKVKLYETQDTVLLTQELEKLWERVPDRKILRVGVTLTNLVAEAKHQISLFESPKSTPLMEALDSVNKKYKRNMIYLGSSQVAKDAAPVRIAFQRIPKEYE